MIPNRTSDGRLIIAVMLLVKILTVIFIIIGFKLLPFCNECQAVNFLSPSNQPVSLMSSFTTWDAQHYIQVATRWYQPNHPSNAFFPLFPTFIALSSQLLFGNVIIAGFLVSTVTSIAAMLVLFGLVERIFNRDVAWKTVLLLITFPTAFYFHLIYSEGTFLLIIALAFWWLRFGNIFTRTMGHTLLSLSRPQGVLLILSHGIALLCNPKQWRRFLPAIAGLGLGYLLYMLIMYFSTGSLLSGLAAQAYFATNNGLDNLLHPLHWLTRNFIFYDWTVLHGITQSLFNRVFFFGFMLALPFLYRSVDRDLFWYTAIVAGVTAVSGDLVSWPRYMLMLFPVFILLALKIKKRYILVTWGIVSGLLQICLLLAHTQNFWVA